MSEECEEKKVVCVIEAPSRQQIAAAKKMRRNLTLPTHEPLSHEAKNQVRSYIEGVVLLLMGAGVAYGLRDIGEIGIIMGAILVIAGFLVIVRSHGK